MCGPILCVFAAMVALADDGPDHSPPPELVDVRKIWDGAPHNAFTDLIRFHDRWFCTFREADRHAGGSDGKIRVIASADGVTWESASLLEEQGIDLRDPKLSITPAGRLMLLMGGSVYGGQTLLSRRPRVAFSDDGRNWTGSRRILNEGDWLWRVTWHEDRAYGVSYRDSGSRTVLYQSQDGIHYQPISEWKVPGGNEATLRFLPDGRMVALVRREVGNQRGWIGVSPAPYTDWTWHEIGHRLGGPNFLQLPDGSLWAASRDHPPGGGTKTVIARMDLDHYQPLLTLPSGGDTSYPGLVWHDGVLWVSYDSSHEGRTSIYLARVKLSQP